MSTKEKKPLVHSGFATGIKHWHVAQIQNDVLTVCRSDKFHLIECNAGPAFVEGRKSTFIKTMDLMNLRPKNKTYLVHLFEMMDLGKLDRAIKSYLETSGSHEGLKYKVLPEDSYNNIHNILIPNEYGMIYIDPPGSVPLFHIYSRIGNNPDFNNYDFLINVFPRSWKRHMGKKDPPDQIKKSGAPLLHLKEYLKMLNRKHWYIRDSSGLNGAVLLFGTNNLNPIMETWNYKIDMFYTATDRGSAILDRHSELQS